MKRAIFIVAIFILIFSQMGIDVGKAASKEQRTICIDPGHQSHQNLDKEPIAPDQKYGKQKYHQEQRVLPQRNQNTNLLLKLLLNYAIP